jgi:hypothetical protein
VGQPLILSPQPIPFALRALQIFFLALNTRRLIGDDLAGISARRLLRAARHDTLMPDSGAPYKRETLGASVCRDQEESGSAER